ncbi:hypothetical protein SAMN02745857_03970 [Andreprevotia lacus DSM 23236]|jgi:hypothetical protein|uniref:Uncharacterized protein n=1 Tax=Andreprevotia lacus DSM 23236 TaxID=1121001 RepID=A0A1W1Y086_9NEIS|nr:hypothetical protein [Andreprevotia lacus]SMC29630.1 hypothetical protein SAMN02745857_03970 [Andreprevotia lacus DSM 23236]
MTSPGAIAAVSAVIIVVLYAIASQFSNGVIRLLARVGSVAVGIYAAATLASDSKVAGVAGEYTLYALVGILLLSRLFGQKA